MRFDLVDAVLEHPTPDRARIVTLKNVSAAEEYLQDHFPGFPVLPGVLMVEALVQAARRLLELRGERRRMVLGGVRAVKYGRFVRPGESLRIEVHMTGETPDSVEFKGEGLVITPGQGANAEAGAGTAGTAVSGRFALRPVRL